MGGAWKRSVTVWVENGGLGSGRAFPKVCVSGIWKPLAGGLGVRDPWIPKKEPHGDARGVGEVSGRFLHPFRMPSGR
jgi:hypothetical protein